MDFPKEREPEEIKALTGVRAFAAWWVLILHYSMAFPAIRHTGIFGFVGRGYIGVDIFFLLSGYILTYVYIDKLRFFTASDCWSFLVLRIARIYPVHLVGLLATIGLFYVAMIVFSYKFNEPDNWRLPHLFFHVTLTHAWGFEDIALWNIPSWSISSEWLAYLTMPFLLPIVFRSNAQAKVALVLLLLAMIIVVYGFFDFDVASSFKGWRAVFRVLSEFWLGVCLYTLIGRTTFPPWAGELSVVLALCGFVILPYCAVSDVWLLLLCPVLIVGLHKSSGMVSRFFSSAVMVYLGRVSYSVYVVHFPVQLVLDQLYERMGVSGGGLSAMFIGLVVAMLVAVMAGVFLFKYVETPLRKTVKERVCFCR